MSANNSLDFNTLSSYREREVLIDDSRENKFGSIASEVDKLAVSSDSLSEAESVIEKGDTAEKIDGEYSSLDSAIADKLLLVNDQLSLKSTSLVFEFDDTSEPPIVKVIDKESGDVIREIPPKEMREIAKALTDIADNMSRSVGGEQEKQASGIFIDERF